MHCPKNILYQKSRAFRKVTTLFEIVGELCIFDENGNVMATINDDSDVITAININRRHISLVSRAITRRSDNFSPQS